MYSNLATIDTLAPESGRQLLRAADIGIKFPTRAEIPADVDPGAPIIEKRFLINGAFGAWEGPRQTVLSAICEDVDGVPQRRVLGELPLLSRTEALQAVEAADRAYDNGAGAWPMMDSEERIACVERFLEGMVAKRADVVKLLMWEIGKTAGDAASEFDRTVKYIRNTITELRKLDAAANEVVSGGDVSARVGLGSRGVVLCMGPFNYPLNETFTNLFPALLVGNTVIMKPARFGSLLMSPLLEAFRESFPPGVVNVLYGDGAQIVGPIMESGKVATLAFIGSDRVANILIKQHPAPCRMRPVLGLGAKDPAIVLPGADLENAAKVFVAGALGFNGQRCTALKIGFVPRAVADEFAALVAEEVTKLLPGMPWERGVRLTPMPENGKAEAMKSYVDDAKQHGGRVVNPGGGTSIGTYFHPAVVYPVTPEMRLWKEEQFGPVVPIVPYDDISETIDWVKRCPYRQQASVFGGNSEETTAQVIRTLSKLECRVNLDMQCQRGPDNLPFAAKGDGGLGTLSERDALLEFSAPSLVGTAPRNLDRLIRLHLN